MFNNITFSTHELIVNQQIDINLPNVPYLLIIAINNNDVSDDWRKQCCKWIIKSEQCSCAMAWGYECSIWDDVLDYSYLEFFDYEAPDNKTFLTTWHTDETFDEVLELAKIFIEYPMDQIYKQIVLINIR